MARQNLSFILFISLISALGTGGIFVAACRFEGGVAYLSFW